MIYLITGRRVGQTAEIEGFITGRFQNTCKLVLAVAIYIYIPTNNRLYGPLIANSYCNFYITYEIILF